MNMLLIFWKTVLIVNQIRVDELTGMKYTFFRDPDYLPIELYENNY